MALDKRYIRFERLDLDEVIHEMLTLAARGDGKGWINVQPVVADEDRPPESAVFKLFTARDRRSRWAPGCRATTTGTNGSPPQWVCSTLGDDMPPSCWRSGG